MSIDDLENFITQLEVEPSAVFESSNIEELLSTRDDIGAISAQRDIENRFNNVIAEDFDTNPKITMFDPVISDPADISEVGGKTGSAIKIAMFTLGYPSRILRSVLAITGATAFAERFGDVRRSQGFWTAMLEVVKVEDINFERILQVAQRTEQLVKQIPALLTDPEVSETNIPSIGRQVTGPIPELRKHEWIFDLMGEMIIESSAIKVGKTLARKGMAKFAGKVYEAGEEIVTKKGISRLLGSIDDDELKAIDEAVRFRRVGKLGTKPPQVEIDDAMRRTFDYIKESEPSQLIKKEIISAKRKQGASRMYTIQGDNYGPGYSARMINAGATKSTEKSFKPLLEISPQAFDDERILQKVIDNFDFSGSKIYTVSNTQKSIARLYEYGELLTPGEVEGLRDVFGNAFANSLSKFTDKPTGLAGKLFNAGEKGIREMNATSRALMTTGELSFLLRQANYRAWTRPQSAMRSFSIASRSLVSPKYADKIDDVFRFSRSGKIGTEHGLFLGKWRDVTRLTQREEVFAVEWFDKVPGLKSVLGKPVRGFERGYVSGLNSIRADWFDEGLQLIENSGRGGNDKLISKWATYVNNMTGRADIDAIASGNTTLKFMAETAKDVLFAPRFAASKWNRHKIAAELMFGRETPNSMRRLLANDAAVKWRRYERVAHYFTQNGGSVETNPQSSDFLKLRDGDTRYDVLGGDAQIQVLLARIASGETKDVHTKLLKENVASEIALQYLEGKLNPLWSLIISKSFGKTFDGQDIDDPKVLAKVIRDKFIPLYLNDIKDKIFNEYEEQGKTIAESIKGSRGVGVFGFGGGGIQTFAPSARKKYELAVNDKAQELHAKNYDELPLYLKQEVLWETENDDIDKFELWKEEMGMNRQSRASSARTTKMKNKSFRAIRKGLGDDYNLFKESNIPVREFPLDIGDIRLSTAQHDILTKTYVKNIKKALSQYPELSILRSTDYERRRWLEDIERNAREDAKEEILFLE